MANKIFNTRIEKIWLTEEGIIHIETKIRWSIKMMKYALIN